MRMVTSNLKYASHHRRCNIRNETKQQRKKKGNELCARAMKLQFSFKDYNVPEGTHVERSLWIVYFTSARFSMPMQTANYFNISNANIFCRICATTHRKSMLHSAQCAHTENVSIVIYTGKWIEGIFSFQIGFRSIEWPNLVPVFIFHLELHIHSCEHTLQSLHNCPWFSSFGVIRYRASVCLIKVNKNPLSTME